MSFDTRVVVTGRGAVTPLGCTVAEYWNGLAQGRSGIRTITLFDPSPYDAQIAGEAPGFDPSPVVDKKDLRRMDRYTQLALVAAMEAFTDSGLDLSDTELADQVGVLIGSGIGGIETWEINQRAMFEKGPDRCSPFLIPMMICDMASGHVSIRTGARGPNSCIVTACATGAHSIGEAYEIIRRGDAVAMICGGTEASVTRTSVAGFSSMKALSRRNDAPERASRPWDKERDGFVLGEGAGVLVLEELEHARRRGAPIYAELIGYGLSGDAYHITQPSVCGEGAARAMKMALRKAKLQPSEIDYVNAHGTSTEAGDIAETLAIKSIFGDDAKTVPVSSTKSMTGHLLGAAGGIEAIACIEALRHGILPPTINLENPDPECDLDYVPNEAREVKAQIAMSNSFGFGGHNATLIFREFTG
ncbi:MAG: beta-ketoacyl-ACP synthase II [Armatimonadetes bacterium]|nr:beta-ketoacyl-ACP synthase II [Armatimonadota bacterium]